MIFWIYQSLIIYTILVFHDANALSVEIKTVSGLLGENGTKIECSYTNKQNFKIISVRIFAFNRSSIMLEPVAIYYPDFVSALTSEGQYLKGRVTMTNITSSSTKAIMIYNTLMCIDDTIYRCELKYTDYAAQKDVTKTSHNMSIIVQVPPKKPDPLIWMKAYADSVSTIQTEPISSTTSTSSAAVTTKNNKTISTMNSDGQNNTQAFTHSTLQTTDHNTTSFTPSDEDRFTVPSYRTTTYSIQQTTPAQGIAEGENITVVCTGDVGKPPAEHVFQKYRKGLGLYMTYTASETSISEISENCSYYLTSNLTFQVTATDNNAVIRCVVNSSMAELDLYVETEPIEVYYGASKPNITMYPNNTYYEEGKNTSIHLTCKSDGNPEPYYQWYKENNELISSSKNWTITDMNVTNSGVYTCKVSNAFNGDTYKTDSSVHIQIMNKAYTTTTRITLKHSSTLDDIPTTQSSSTGSSSGVDKKEEKSNGDLGLVVGIVVAVVTVIIVVVVIIAYMRRNSNSPTFKNVTKSFDDSKPKPITEHRTGDYDYIALEGDAPTTKSSNNGLEVEDINKHNAEYLKKQEEEEKKKKESNTTPQPAVYAQVNEATKSKNKLKEIKENTDKQEEDPYAETQEDVYDKAGNSRHKENENVEHFDSLSSSKQNSNGDNKQSIQTSQVGSFTNQGFEKDENRKVATVSPTVRSSTGSQNDEQTNSNRNSQSKKGYENIIGTDQTGISVEESSHRTAL